MLIGPARSDNQVSSPAIVLGDTLTVPVPDVEIFIIGSSPNLVMRSMRRSMKMSTFAVTREISFHLPVFFVDL